MFAVAIIIPRSLVPGMVSGSVQILSAHRLDELNKSVIKAEPHYNPVGVTRIVPILQVRTLRLNEVFLFPLFPLPNSKFLL